jgi:alkylation response protein AidB-like acyl-CoA dehydrogenase
MSVDLDLDDVQTAIADSVAHYCRDRCTDDVVRRAGEAFPRDLWKGLADLGVLALGAPGGDGGAQEACAAVEQLGAALFPGPLAAAFLAAQVLPAAERERVIAGDALVSFGSPPLMPWAPIADLWLVLDEAGSGGASDRAVIVPAEPTGQIEAVETLGGEPWGRVELRRGAAVENAERGLAFYSLVLAAYLAAAGRALVDVAAEHARTRKQFGRPIGDFQAIAHPLADCSMRLVAASTLARATACRLDGDDPRALGSAAAARLSANRAALDAAQVCHQTFGAMGVTEEGPVFSYSRRIRQLASLPPSIDTEQSHVLALFEA